MSVQLRPLDLGGITGPHAWWERGAPDDPFRLPVTAWLIAHDRGVVLFDCGMHTDLTTDTPKREIITSFLDLDAEAASMVSTQLRALDVDPGDVVAVVASHLHWDHVGGLAQLPNARLIVQRAEWESANDPAVVAAGPYEADEYQTGHQVTLVEGPHDVFGDGALTCVPTPGHTAGHQSLLVDAGGTSVLLTGDCCYFERTVDGGPLPRFGFDLEQQRESIAVIRSIRDRGAVVIPAHDPVHWSRRPSVIGRAPT